MAKLFLFITAAHAGWFGRLCEKYLIMDDPYQYEQTDYAYLDRRIEALEIKRRWGKLQGEEAAALSAMRAELKRRDLTNKILTTE